MGSRGILTFALLGFILSGVWGLFTFLRPGLTPSALALVSLIMGVFPLALSLVGLAIARLLGGEVDGGGARNCNAFGINFAPLVEFLFMCHWLVLLTGGLAICGLMASGFWALVR